MKDKKVETVMRVGASVQATKVPGPQSNAKARSPEETTSEDFQIVRLWEKNDWQELNTKGAVDRCYSDLEAVELFRKVIGNKGGKKYPTEVRREFTLLIDANPVARTSDFVASIENEIAPFARQAGYKAVWIVGTAMRAKSIRLSRPNCLYGGGPSNSAGITSPNQSLLPYFRAVARIQQHRASQ